MILNRPLSVIDTETTGTDIETDRIVSFAVTNINTDWQTKSLHRLVNPLIPIPEGATAVHKITNEMVAQAKTWSHWGPAFLQTIDGTDLVSYNGDKFDFPLIYNEFQRIGIEWDYRKYNFIDVYRLIALMEPRTLSRMFKFYLGYEMEDAHNAEADTNATAAILTKQLEVYQELPGEIKELSLLINNGMPMADLSGKFKYNEAGEPYYNFGKHIKETVKNVSITDPSYKDWFLSKDFPNDSKNFLRSLFPQQQQNTTQQ